MSENKTEQPMLFPEVEGYEKEEWRGMPEYVQPAREVYAEIIVRCMTKEDLDAFAKAVGMNLNRKSKSIWYPLKARGLHSRKRYVDESDSHEGVPDEQHF